ncbi:PIN domain-containing protein [Moorena sp. SIO3H5]|uniref:PIN domain-containing protein n=1 Tax=Moorena sp. SIO3H5 TaxID=2607834 RepID=UPI0013B9C3B1|nr:PIN domain-containing protein [Moorena sp. SIO3H5]NEO72361.1 type II toxin-antitoxin system VapC family toxin [Moorena sp. SIO3H5]
MEISNKNSYKIYLDVCCLNRLYDDQSQLRIRLESEAISEIIVNCQLGKWELIISTIIESEISKTPLETRREKVRESLSIGKTKIFLTQSILTRAKELTTFSFKKYDALHVASAEGHADIFLTTDDRLLRKSITYKNQLNIIVANPVTWLLEIHKIKGEQENDTN